MSPDQTSPDQTPPDQNADHDAPENSAADDAPPPPTRPVMRADNPLLSAPSILTIDIRAVEQNYRYLRDKIDPASAVAGVVKADAYGLGMDKIVPVLESLQCPYYFVATLAEGRALRRMTDKPIAILCGVAGPAELYLKENLTPVLNSLRDIEIWNNAAIKAGRRLPATIHFDTGMHRLGLDEFETLALVEEPKRLSHLDVAMIMSHMACADDPHDLMTGAQFEGFRAIAAEFPNAQKSIANSSALFRHAHYHCDYVRPGMALYGLNPTPERKNPMHNVVTLDTRVLQVRRLREGDTIGYGATYTMPHDGVLATCALGYADGLPRVAGDKLNLYWQGKPCPVRGRISMDVVTVEITGHKPAPIAGDFMEVIGPHQSVDELAQAFGTIGYEVLTNLSRRAHRIYKDR